MMLSQSKQGKYTVISLPNGRNVRHKLNIMGIILESTIEVTMNKKYYPMVIKVGNSTLSIGRGIASKIIVKPL